jgi:hypothetical protein
MESLQVYSRQGCHLCELLIEELLPLVRDRLALEVIDIDRDPQLVAAYGTRVPVVEFRGRLVCQYHLDNEAIRDVLAAASGS